MDVAYFQPLGASEILPRYAWLEPLLRDARALEVACVASTGGRSAANLRARGARTVLAIDPSPAAVDAARSEFAASTGLEFRCASPAELRDGGFDLVLIPDASPYIREPRALDDLRRLTSPGGRVLFAVRNLAGPGLAQLACDEGSSEPPPTFGETLACLRDRFSSVQVFSQTALVGYQFAAAHGASEPEIAVDGTLLDRDEECAWFLALCGRMPWVQPARLTLVALPVSPLAVAAGRRTELAERLRLTERAEREAATAAGRLSAERGALESRLSQRDAEAADLRRALLELRQRGAAQAPGPASAGDAPRGGELERRLAEAEGARRAATLRLETEQARARQLERSALEHSAAARRAREALAAEVEHARAAIEARLAEQLDGLRAQLDDARRRAAALEEQNRLLETRLAETEAKLTPDRAAAPKS